MGVLCFATIWWCDWWVCCVLPQSGGVTGGCCVSPQSGGVTGGCCVLLQCGGVTGGYCH